jgi:O-antigen ligase
MRAIDWPLAAVAVGFGIALAFSDGGYFPTDWGWSALALFWVAAIALFLRSRFSFGPLEVAMLAAFAGFVGWVALSSTWSTSLERSILEAQRDLVYLGGLIVVFLVARGRSVTELLAAVCGAALVTSTYALAHVFFFGAEVDARLSEPLGYPNALALVAAIGALLAAAFAAHAGSKPTRALSAACLVLFTLTIFFTFSRGTWIALAIGLAAMLLLDRRRGALLRTLAAVVPVALLAVWLGSRADALTSPGGSPSDAARQGHLLALATVLLVAAAALSTLAARRLSVAAVATLLVALLAGSAAAIVHFGSGPRLGYLYNGPAASNRRALTQRSLSGRIPLWRQAWRDWEAHPGLGSGGGTFEQWWLRHRRTSANVRDAHNLYLETLAELGPFGLVLLVATLALPLVPVARARLHPFVPGAAAAYVAFLIHAAGDWDWEMPAVTLLGFLCGAALLLAVRKARQWALPTGARAVALAGTLALAFVGFVGLIGNGALAASARAADAERWQQSASEARKAIHWLPWSAEAWQRLAVAESNEGQAAAARASLQKAIAKSPDEWRPWASLMRLSTGRAQRQALRQAARLNPRDPEVVQFLLAPGSLTQRFRYDDAWTGWPVTPLHRQHPIHGSFLDPRTGTLRAGGDAAYHFGIDVAVRDDRPEAGAPPGRTHRVFAVEGGTALLPERWARGPCEDRKVSIGHFDYWHVDASGVLRDGGRIRPGQMIGWTCKGLWHVHLSEWMELYGRRVYVNPVHPGMKLGPYVDRQPPEIRAIAFYRPAMPRWIAAERAVFPTAGVRFPRTSTGRALLSGRVDVRAWIDDPPPRPSVLGSAAPPDGVALQVVREGDGRPVLGRTVFRAAVFLGDSRGTQAVPIGYHYAPGTRETLPVGLCLKAQRTDCGARYWFRLFARPTSAYWDTRRIANGTYRLRVRAWDASGNSATAAARITIRNV